MDSPLLGEEVMRGSAWKDTMETDGYQGYNTLPDIKRYSCWAHIRGYFIDAVPKGKQYDYSRLEV